MLEARHKVLSSQLAQVTLLAVHPVNTLAKLDGVGLAVLGDGVALSQSGLMNALNIILIQAVNGVYQSLGIGSIRGSQCVPDLNIGGESQGIAVLELVALARKVLLSPCLIGAGALQLAPLSLHLVAVLSKQRSSVDNKSLMESVHISAPVGVVDGVGSHSAYSIDAALSRHGQEGSQLKQLCLGNSHLRITLGNTLGVLLRVIIQSHELAEVCVIDLLGRIQRFKAVCQILKLSGGGITGSGRRLSSRGRIAGCQKNHCHAQSKQRNKNLLRLHLNHSLMNFPYYPRPILP